MRSTHPRLFFSKQEEKEIVNAIRLAEIKTSGEIRIHLDNHDGPNLLAYAQELFEKKGMTQTLARNGVLIYLCPRTREFAVIGDAGIHEKVPAGFWDSIVLTLQSHFKENRFANGLCEGIFQIGEKLQAYFPRQKNDINELTDEISYGT